MNAPNMFALMSAVGTDSWVQELFDFNPNLRFPLIVVVVGCLTGVIITLVTAVISAVSKANQQRIEADLKREMLDRGMSADEVAKVIEATAPDETTKMILAARGRKK
jgi:hypothetical protein